MKVPWKGYEYEEEAEESENRKDWIRVNHWCSAS